MTAPRGPSSADDRRRLRAWLEYVAQTEIDMLDDMDAEGADLEPDVDDEVEDAA